MHFLLNDMEYLTNFTFYISPWVTTSATVLSVPETMVFMLRRKGWMVIQESCLMSTEIKCDRRKLERGDWIYPSFLTCLFLYKITGHVDFLFNDCSVVGFHYHHI